MSETPNGGRPTVAKVYELIESKFTPLDTRLRAVERTQYAILAILGGQVVAALKGTSLPALILGLFS